MAAKGIKLRALFPCSADPAENRPAFDKNETLLLIQKHTSGWWEVQTAAGNHGFISPAWVEEMDDTTASVHAPLPTAASDSRSPETERTTAARLLNQSSMPSARAQSASTRKSVNSNTVNLDALMESLHSILDILQEYATFAREREDLGMMKLPELLKLVQQTLQSLQHMPKSSQAELSHGLVKKLENNSKQLLKQLTSNTLKRPFDKREKKPENFAKQLKGQKKLFEALKIALEEAKDSCELVGQEMTSVDNTATKNAEAPLSNPSSLGNEKAEAFWRKEFGETSKTEWGPFYNAYEKEYNGSQKFKPLRNYLGIGGFVELSHVKTAINEFGQWPLVYDEKMIENWDTQHSGARGRRQSGVGRKLMAKIANVLGMDKDILKAVKGNRIPEVVKLLQEKPDLINTKFTDKSWTPLHFAAFHAREDMVKRMLVVAGDNIKTSIKDVDGRTAIDLAAENDHLPIVKLLFPIFGNVQFGPAARGAQRETFGWLLEKTTNALEELGKEFKKSKAIHQAAMWGNVDAIRLMSKAGVDSDDQDRAGRSAAHYAIHSDQLEALSVLAVECDANLDQADDAGMTPLMHAVLNKPSEIAEELLLLNADPNVVNPENGRTAMFLCALRDDVDRNIVQTLVKHGADINCCDITGRTPLHALSEIDSTNLQAAEVVVGMAEVFLEEGMDIEAEDFEGNTPCVAASEGGALPLLDKLLDKGADPQHRNESQQTALHHASSPAIVDRLVKAGASVHVADVKGNTPLHLQAQKGQVQMVDTLLKHGSRPQTTNFDGDTALHCACDSAVEECVTSILDAVNKDTDTTGADLITELVNVQNRQGQTASHRAVQVQSVPILSRFRTLGADLSIADQSGNNPVHVAAASDNSDILSTVLQFDTCNADVVNAKNQAGDTPLIVSSALGKIPEVNLLLEHGANAGASNNAGQTASKVAMISGKGEVLDVLADNELHRNRNAGMGLLKIGLLWETKDDLDLSVITPKGNRIYFRDRKHDGGELDIDENAGFLLKAPAAEHVFWKEQSTCPEGRYTVICVQYCHRPRITDPPSLDPCPYQIKLYRNSTVVYSLASEVYSKGYDGTMDNGPCHDSIGGMPHRITCTFNFTHENGITDLELGHGVKHLEDVMAGYKARGEQVSQSVDLLSDAEARQKRIKAASRSADDMQARRAALAELLEGSHIDDE